MADLPETLKIVVTFSDTSSLETISTIGFGVPGVAPIPNLEIGTVTTLPAGSQATATFTGFSPDFFLNLGIPNGDSIIGAYIDGSGHLILDLAFGSNIDAGLLITGDLAAIEALNTTGFPARTGSETWALRSLANAAAGITWTNPAGVAGNPTPVLANDLAAVEGLATTGLVRRTGADTWSAGTTVATAEITDDAVTYAKIQNVSATDKVLGRSTAGAGDVEEIPFTPFARSLADDADAATARTTLGVVIGTNVQAQDAELQAIAGLTSAADQLPYFTGSGTAALTTLSTYGRSLIDDADASAARTTLGLTSPATATPAALTKTDDTNVTATLGGTPGTALLQATSITLGWTGTLAVARGGTGAATAANARTNLGLVIGTDVQGYDATLQALGGVTTAADKLMYATGVDTFTTTDLTLQARGLLDDASYSAMRTTLGLAIGTDVQAFDSDLTTIAGFTPLKGRMMVGDGTAWTLLAPGTDSYVLTADSAQTVGLTWTAAGGGGGGAPTTSQYVTLATDAGLANERVLTAGTNISITDAGAGSTVTVAISDAELNAIAGLTSAADKSLYFTGSGTASTYDLSSVARTLLAQTSQANMRTTGLGLGSIATQASSSVSITGGSVTGITDITVADGGTGLSTLTANNVILGNGTSSPLFVAPGASGNQLTSNGTTWQSTAPSSGGAKVLLSSSAPSAVADITFTSSLINSTYKSYQIEFEGLTPTNTVLTITLSRSGSFLSSGYAQQGYASRTSLQIIRTTAASSFNFEPNSNFTSDGAGVIKLFYPSDTNHRGQIHYTGGHYDSNAGGSWVGTTWMGYLTSAAGAVDGIKISCGGTITASYVNLYGIT